MTWQELAPDTVDALSERLNLAGSRCLCRGQSQTQWDLTPSIVRSMRDRLAISSRGTHEAGPDDALALLLELQAIGQFRKHADMHLSATERKTMGSIIGTLSLMQHYGAPTRLLDWTRSPWAAAYFAAVQDPGEDGAVWIVDQYALQAKSRKLFSSQLYAMTFANNNEYWVKALRDPVNAVGIIELMTDNPRMSAQQSIQTISGSFHLPHDVMIEEMVASRYRDKVVIKKELKKPLMRRLVSMNLSGYSLFGGPDGVAKLVAEELVWGQEIRANIPRDDLISFVKERAAHDPTTHDPSTSTASSDPDPPATR